MGEDRDILIEMRSDMKHVRERVDQLAASDIKQWEKLDAQGVKVAEHESTLSFLNWGFRGVVGSVFALAYAWIKGDK